MSVESRRASKARYRASLKGRRQESIAYLKRIDTHPLGQTKCRQCSVIVDVLDAINRGMNPARALCEFCG
ncbi:hypothetical protein UFOVP813_5 [uncultured Caudovirales phage]|uniref:Uncharacterized protein n=1 Tax=uncultured Caudovirales phage TaxID=2100421 RepID=A0A6J5NWK8_9CAUD|nr:hypothetical protein UFOVP813_5 [uncultured Caudovirales phage]